MRAFCQDDAHIFCTHDQIKDEMSNALEFLTFIYSKFGFQFDIYLSTRPSEFIGDIEIWNKAEQELTEVLNYCERKWDIKVGDGAFYGPKIDIQLTDSLGRKHQCATIQLDFQLPHESRFNLQYVDNKGNDQTPVIIHRAIYGSFERFIAILCEHYNGKFPFWLNPKQIKLIPIAQGHLDYANNISKILRENKYYVDIDKSDDTLNKKIRQAQVENYNYTLVIGQKEIDTNMINVRYRDTNIKKICSLDDLLIELQESTIQFK